MPGNPIVLLVEDEALVKELLGVELEDAGFDVVTAENGDEAADLLSGGLRIDVLLTDIRMPGRIDGWALADLARSLLPNLPVVYVSGYSPQQGMEAEKSVFLKKPYRIAELLQAIRTVIEPGAGPGQA